MNPAQIHLALNHMPLFLSLVAGIILLIGLWKQNDLVITIALYGLIGAALVTLPVYLTGEGTEEVVEKIQGVNEGIIEDHESFAKITLVVILISGLVSLVAIFIRKSAGFRKGILVGLTLLSFLSFLLMAQTARLGGKIRHTEIGNAVAAANGETEKEKTGGENTGKDPEEKDDD